jgi:hypothetical protein
MAEFYSAVYGDLDVPALLDTPTGRGDVYGYRHHVPHVQLLSGSTPVYIASNSPREHVLRVLACLGLSTVPFQGILTPDSTGQFFTKASPGFWDALLRQHPPDRHEVILFDDNQSNLEAASRLGIRGVHVTDEWPLDRAVSAVLGVIPDPSVWRFSELQYLEAKNAVDRAALSQRVADRLGHELSLLRLRKGNRAELRVVDLGAGLLSMLEPVVRLAAAKGARWTAVDYVAYEINPEVVQKAVRKLQEAGYSHLEGQGGDSGDPDLKRVPSMLFSKAVGGENGSQPMQVHVEIRTQDFARAASKPIFDGNRPPDLIVGCCLADLYSPEEMTSLLLKLAKGHPSLAYLPITFAGRTCLRPQAPEAGATPSDGHALAAYHRSLREMQGHNLEPGKLVACLERHGAGLLCQGPSDWLVKFAEHPRMWESMLYFCGLGILPYLAPEGWDVAAWRSRAWATKPDFEVRGLPAA